MLYALLPVAGGAPAAPAETGKTKRCMPREVRGMQRFLNPRGELQLFFPDCLPIAAPFILFRLKRQGFSGCLVQAVEGGLRVQGRR
jgi:hypothetical protein